MSFDRRVESEADRFGDRPVRTTIRWGLAAASVFVALAIVVGVAGFATGWLGAGKDIVSPANVKAQHEAIIGGFESLQAAAANACQARATARADGDPTLVESPALAYEAQYRRIEAEYNRRQANVFEAGKVGPSGYPKVAPSLADMQAEVC